MTALTAQEKEVVKSFRSLDPGRRRFVLLEMARANEGAWAKFQQLGEANLREAARRQGRDWDRMDDQHRQDFVEEYLDRRGG
jgi:hypothetical protein